MDYLLLLKLKKNEIRMMGERGYDITNEAPLLSYEAANVQVFIDYYKQVAHMNGISFVQALGNFYQRPDSYVGQDTGPLLTVWMDKEGNTISKGRVQALIDTLLSPDYAIIRKVLLVIATPLSSAAKGLLDQLATYRVEIFDFSDLSYVPIDNYLVPKHTLLTAEERTAFLKKLGSSSMPIISLYDPIARYYGALPGQIFKIERIDLSGTMTVTKSLFYRIVVDKPLAKNKVKKEK